MHLDWPWGGVRKDPDGVCQEGPGVESLRSRCACMGGWIDFASIGTISDAYSVLFRWNLAVTRGLAGAQHL